jgi:hypothetical protein
MGEYGEPCGTKHDATGPHCPSLPLSCGFVIKPIMQAMRKLKLVFNFAANGVRNRLIYFDPMV